VVITTFDLDEYVHGALKAGARGFLLKDAGLALLTQAIHAAADGDALIAPSVTVRLLAAFAHTQTSPPRQPIEPLTAREEEVLVPVAQGRTNNEIASELYITPSTVKPTSPACSVTVAANRSISALASASSTCSSDMPGRPGCAESAANAPSFAARHTETTVERSTPYLAATSRWVPCPVNSATHISYFCEGANTRRFLRVVVFFDMP